MKKIFLTITLAVGLMATAQVKIGNDPTNIDANSILELETTNQGLLFPRVALVSTTSYAPLNDTLPNTKQKGMTVYNTATTAGATGVTPGLYSNDGTNWVKLGGSSATVFTARTSQVSISNYDWTNSGAGLVKFYEFISGTGPINLPDAATYNGQIIHVRNNTGASIFFGSLDGVNRPNGVPALVASAAMQIWSDGSKWHNIAGRN